MNAQHKNLFPAAIKTATIEIFGEQSVQPFLLQLIPAYTTAGLLHPQEKIVLSSYRLAKRRTEYVTGRICAKRAVQDFLRTSETSSHPLTPAEIAITPTSDGRPTVHLLSLDAKPCKVDLSISHSGDYAAALAARSPCGIDLQMQKSALIKVQEKYCTEAETHLLANRLANCELLTRLTLLWAAKEAGKKALSYWQMPGFLDLQLSALTSYPGYFSVSLKIINSTNKHFPERITVVAAMFSDYAVAICLVPAEGDNAGVA